MPSDFESTLTQAASELIADPGVGGHIHFDDPVFRGLVPDFHDIEWLDLAREVAAILSPLPGRLAVQVPIGIWGDKPDLVVLDDLTELDPWFPPAFLATIDRSAHQYRLQANPMERWYSDDVPAAAGAVGWLSAVKTLDYPTREASDDPTDPAWMLSLMYETKPTEPPQ
jgi:hypothetical protein